MKKLKNMKIILNYLFLFLILSSFSWADVHIEPNCNNDKVKQEARSNELQKIMKADQDARVGFEKMTSEQLQKMAKEDKIRRERVDEISMEGCIVLAKDYLAAALIFQHGDEPEHFFKAYDFALRAVQLGDEKQKNSVALAVDRYLVSIGHKQLFGSQAFKAEITDKSCWCLHQIEKSFTDERRKKYIDKTLKDQISWLNDLNKGKVCPNVYCNIHLKDSPMGTLKGFW